MDGWMDEWMDGWMDELIDGWMDGIIALLLLLNDDVATAFP